VKIRIGFAAKILNGRRILVRKVEKGLFFSGFGRTADQRGRKRLRRSRRGRIV